MLDKITVQLLCLMSLKRDRRAVTALEYGLIASLIAAAVITGVGGLKTSLTGRFNAIATAISTG